MPRFREFEDMKGQPICVNLDRILWAQAVPEAIGSVVLVIEMATGILPGGQILSGPVHLQVKGSRKAIFDLLQGKEILH